jgi:hypothetical protein
MRDTVWGGGMTDQTIPTYKQAEDLIESLMALAYGENWCTVEERVFYGYIGGKLQGLIDAGLPRNSRPYMDMIALVERLAESKTTTTK